MAEELTRSCTRPDLMHLVSDRRISRECKLDGSTFGNALADDGSFCYIYVLLHVLYRSENVQMLR